jgi:hypothetical protein
MISMNISSDTASISLSPPFLSLLLTSRATVLRRVSQLFEADGDLVVTGVAGSGRRSVIHVAAQQVGARVLQIDCLQTTTSTRFLELLAEGFLEVFSDPAELELIEQWSAAYPLTLAQPAQIIWQVPVREEWVILQALLTLPQVMAEHLDCRIVLVFQNFPHIRSWDRSGQWEKYLRQEISRQSRVNYVIIATTSESWMSDSNLQMVTLAPLHPEDLRSWLWETMADKKLKFDGDAIDLFLDSVQGHWGDAIALTRRLWLEYHATELGIDAWDLLGSLQVTSPASFPLIQRHHVYRSILALVHDRSKTFESLLLLLPPIQARVLESLAIDPTHSPHARHYVRKHQLSKGGGLQGALVGLEQKGLIYGGELGYQVAMPLLAFWLKHRMT